MRSRYDGFLSDEYDPEDVYARSTQVDRTIMSTQLAAAGLYPVSLDSNWNDTINWTPIPTYNFPKFIDSLFHLEGCSEYLH